MAYQMPVALEAYRHRGKIPPRELDEVKCSRPSRERKAHHHVGDNREDTGYSRGIQAAAKAAADTGNPVKLETVESRFTALWSKAWSEKGGIKRRWWPRKRGGSRLPMRCVRQ